MFGSVLAVNARRPSAGAARPARRTGTGPARPAPRRRAAVRDKAVYPAPRRVNANAAGRGLMIACPPLNLRVRQIGE